MYLSKGYNEHFWPNWYIFRNYSPRQNEKVLKKGKNPTNYLTEILLQKRAFYIVEYTYIVSLIITINKRNEVFLIKKFKPLQNLKSAKN